MPPLTHFTLLELSRNLARLLAETDNPNMKVVFNPPSSTDEFEPIPVEDVAIVDGKVVLS